MGISAPEPRKALSRRNFLKLSGLAVVGLPFYASEIARHRIGIERLTLRLARLPDAFRGLRIVQISDFHYAEFTEAFFIRMIVDEVNRLKPDVVVFTGDYITRGFWSYEHTVTFAYQCVEMLSRVQCAERYAVLGNHDCMLNRFAVFDALRTHGIMAFDNQAVPLERAGKRLWFAGAGDALCGLMKLDQALPAASQTDGE